MVHVAPCEALTGEKCTVTARVTEYPTLSEDYSRLTVRVLEGAPRERAWLYLYHDELPDLRPGDIVTAEIKIVSAMDRGGSRLHSATAAGISLRGYFTETVTRTGRDPLAWRYLPQEISRYVQETCGRLFAGDAAIFMKALLTGDKQELYDDVPLYESMRQSGVLHAVAVSGMHIFVLITFLRMLLGRGRRTSLISLPVMGLFVLMSGCGASVVRAAVMQTIYISAPIFGREEDGPSALSAALLVLLIHNPMAVGGIGLQLSFACMVGYAVFLPGILYRIARRRWLRDSKLVNRALGNLGNTLCATVFSAPVAAMYFGAVPLFSPLANLLTLTVVEICFAGGYVLCLAAAIWPAAASVGAWVLTWGIRWCTMIYRFIGSLPFACLYTVDRWAVLWLAFVYALFFAWSILRRRGLRLAAVLPAELGIIALCAVLLAGTIRLGLGRREMSVLDVGQGECVVLFDRDSAVVVDCGGSNLYNAGDTAADYLLAAGKRHVDLLVLSHLHEDHTNGVETLLYRMPVRTLILPADAEDSDGMYERLRSAAERFGTEVLLLEEPAEVVVGELSLRLMLPDAGSGENDRGIVTQASYPGVSALIMGDAGKPSELRLLAAGLLEDADILVAGHHGAKTSAGALFLRAIRAETAVISVGYNSYGQPAEETVDRMMRYGCRVLRTDRSGTVTISMKTES